MTDLNSELAKLKYDTLQEQSKLETAKLIKDPLERAKACAEIKIIIRGIRAEMVKIKEEARTTGTERLTKRGPPQQMVLVKALSHYPFQFNEMSLEILLDGKVITEADIFQLSCKLGATNPWDAGREDMWSACYAVASAHRIHPLKERILSLKWDGEQRINRVVSEILRCSSSGENLAGKVCPSENEVEEDKLRVRYVRYWMLGAIERLIRPGAKVDNALILVGGEGQRKSSFFSCLGGDYYSDVHMDLSRSDTSLMTKGKWILEWPELGTTRRAKDEEEVKAYMTRQIDEYRVPYDRSITKQPRTFVLAGTSNPSDVLGSEGGRRYMIIQMGEQQIDLPLLNSWQPQLWAEAVALHEAAKACPDCASTQSHPDKRCTEHRWWMDEHEQRVQMRKHEAHRAENPWDSILRNWLAEPEHDAESYDAAYLLSWALSIPAERQTPRNLREVRQALSRIGWQLSPSKHVPRLWFRPKG